MKAYLFAQFKDGMEVVRSCMAQPSSARAISAARRLKMAGMELSDRLSRGRGYLEARARFEGTFLPIQKLSP